MDFLIRIMQCLDIKKMNRINSKIGIGQLSNTDQRPNCIIHASHQAKSESPEVFQGDGDFFLLLLSMHCQQDKYVFTCCRVEASNKSTRNPSIRACMWIQHSPITAVHVQNKSTITELVWRDKNHPVRRPHFDTLRIDI